MNIQRILLQCRVQQDEGTQLSVKCGWFRQWECSVVQWVEFPQMCAGLCFLSASPCLAHLKLFQSSRGGGLVSSMCQVSCTISYLIARGDAE